MLAGGACGEVTPALVQFALLPVVAAEQGRTLSQEVAPGCLTVSIR
jgi:hypothetical protein